MASGDRHWPLVCAAGRGLVPFTTIGSLKGTVVFEGRATFGFKSRAYEMLNWKLSCMLLGNSRQR